MAKHAPEQEARNHYNRETLVTLLQAACEQTACLALQGREQYQRLSAAMKDALPAFQKASTKNSPAEVPKENIGAALSMLQQESEKALADSFARSATQMRRALVSAYLSALFGE